MYRTMILMLLITLAYILLRIYVERITLNLVDATIVALENNKTWYQRLVMWLLGTGKMDQQTLELSDWTIGNIYENMVLRLDYVNEYVPGLAQSDSSRDWIGDLRWVNRLGSRIQQADLLAGLCLLFLSTYWLQGWLLDQMEEMVDDESDDDSQVNNSWKVKKNKKKEKNKKKKENKKKEEEVERKSKEEEDKRKKEEEKMKEEEEKMKEEEAKKKEEEEKIKEESTEESTDESDEEVKKDSKVKEMKEEAKVKEMKEEEDEDESKMAEESTLDDLKRILYKDGKFMRDMKHEMRMEEIKKENRENQRLEKKNSRVAQKIEREAKLTQELEKAKLKLKQEAMVTEALKVDPDLTGIIIGTKGQLVQSLRQRYGVSITVPGKEDVEGSVVIKGDVENVQKVIKIITKKIAEGTRLRAKKLKSVAENAKPAQGKKEASNGKEAEVIKEKEAVVIKNVWLKNEEGVV